jgi:hypothetical protein
MKRRHAFLFFSVETQSHRRSLVIAYYAVFAMLCLIMATLRGTHGLVLLLQLTAMAAFYLGGTSAKGPVRLFSHWQRKFVDGSIYGIDPRRMRANGAASRLRVDEQDLYTRDRAHYLAYAATRWAVILFALFGPLVVYEIGISAFGRLLVVLCVPFCVLFLSLPQAIILWNEPDLEADPQEQEPQTVIRIVP